MRTGSINLCTTITLNVQVNLFTCFVSHLFTASVRSERHHGRSHLIKCSNTKLVGVVKKKTRPLPSDDSTNSTWNDVTRIPSVGTDDIYCAWVCNPTIVQMTSDYPPATPASCWGVLVKSLGTHPRLLWSAWQKKTEHTYPMLSGCSGFVVGLNLKVIHSWIDALENENRVDDFPYRMLWALARVHQR